MRELRIESTAADGRYLIARDPESGEQFRVLAEESWRPRSTPPRTPPPRTGRKESQMSITLSPREIQSRIRHGASPDEVAELADVPRERIDAFALPVLAEREHIAERARSTAVRRRYADGLLTLEAAIAQNLVGSRLDDAAWDSWRREDGRWAVVVQFAEREPAEFVYDVQGRYVTAVSASASALIGDTLEATSAEMALAQAVSAPVDPPELSETEPDPADAIEAEPLYLDEPDLDAALAAEEPAAEAAEPLVAEPLVAEPPAEHDEPPAGVASLKEARARRAMEQLALADLGLEEEPPLVFEDDEQKADSREDRGPDPAPEPPPAAPEPASGMRSDAPRSAGHDTADEPPPRPNKKRERRRVPSWDEIMFGSSSS